MQKTGAVPDRELTEQLLDTMDLERERGITIKAQAVRLPFRASDGFDYQLNLIDTPGHVDFAYEVSRSLSACEGAVLVVDATQGVQAQTLANVFLALEHGLTIIPVVNKIDLRVGEPELVADELIRTFGFDEDEIIHASAKTGTGVDDILEAIVSRIAPPEGRADGELRALIFDSKYDPYKGVIAHVRVVDGRVGARARIRLMSSAADTEILEVGFFGPEPQRAEGLSTGEVGYLATGLKNVRDCRVGDTVTLAAMPAAEPLQAYEPLKPMVYTGLYPADGESYPELRDGLGKLQLNDAALSFEPETSTALGFGFRCGFLGLLHMDIVQERLAREYDLSLIATVPSVRYRIRKTDGSEVEIDNPADMPPVQQIKAVLEPWVHLSIISPDRHIGPIMELVSTRRGEYARMEYLQGDSSGPFGPEPVPVPGQRSSRHGIGTQDTALQQAQDTAGLRKAGDARVLLEYRIPLAEILVDFHDQLKSRTQGYASMDYSPIDYREANLVKLEILVNQQPVDALSLIVHRENAMAQGRELVSKLRKLIPRQLFEVPIQAAIGSRVIARETIRALRKNVTAKCYGGDVTRKRKLLQKQAEGKKRMKMIGEVEVPQEAFMAVLSLERK